MRPGVVGDRVDGVFPLKIVRAVVEALLGGLIRVDQPQAIPILASTVLAAAGIVFRPQFALAHIQRLQFLGQQPFLKF